MSAQVTNFKLRTDPGSRAIARALTCCLARGLEVVELSWNADGPEGRASLALSGDADRLARAGLWLERLVDVRVVAKGETTPLARGRF